MVTALFAANAQQLRGAAIVELSLLEATVRIAGARCLNDAARLNHDIRSLSIHRRNVLNYGQETVAALVPVFFLVVIVVLGEFSECCGGPLVRSREGL